MRFNPFGDLKVISFASFRLDIPNKCKILAIFVTGFRKRYSGKWNEIQRDLYFWGVHTHLSVILISILSRCHHLQQHHLG